MVGLDDAVVHGEVRDNLLLVVDLLLVVQHEVFFILCTPSSFSSLVFLQALPILQNLPIFFQTSLVPVSVSIAYPITPVARGFRGIMAYALSTSTSCAGAEPAEPFFRITQVAWKLTCCSRS